MNNQQITIKQIRAKWITEDNFKPYGQLITATKDGKLHDSKDAQLNLSNGIPRFYIMHLEKKGRKFSKITRHSLCTQCLGSLEGKDWLIAVAPPSESQKTRSRKTSSF